MNNRVLLNDDIQPKIYKYVTNPEIAINNLKVVKNELKQSNIIKIYTDGSHANSNTTFAVVAYSQNNKIYEKVKRLQEDNSVFQAELQAVVEAVQWALSSK